MEHDFHQVKDRPVGLSPLFVWREDQIRGLTRLLTLALRLLTLIATQVAQGLGYGGPQAGGLVRRATATSYRPPARLLCGCCGP